MHLRCKPYCLCASSSLVFLLMGGYLALSQFPFNCHSFPLGTNGFLTANAEINFEIGLVALGVHCGWEWGFMGKEEEMGTVFSN